MKNTEIIVDGIAIGMITSIFLSIYLDVLLDIVLPVYLTYGIIAPLTSALIITILVLSEKNKRKVNWFDEEESDQ